MCVYVRFIQGKSSVCASNSRDKVAKRISDPGLVLPARILFALAGAAREGDPPQRTYEVEILRESIYTLHICMYVCMYWHAHSSSLSGLTAVRTQFILIAMARANALRECHIALCIKNGNCIADYASRIRT